MSQATGGGVRVQRINLLEAEKALREALNRVGMPAQHDNPHRIVGRAVFFKADDEGLALETEISGFYFFRKGGRIVSCLCISPVTVNSVVPQGIRTFTSLEFPEEGGGLWILHSQDGRIIYGQVHFVHR